MDQSVPVTKKEEQPEEPDTPEQQDEESSDSEDLSDDESLREVARDIFINFSKLEELTNMKKGVEKIVSRLDGQAKHNKYSLFNRLRRGHAIPKNEAKIFKMCMDKRDLWSQRLNVLKKDEAKLLANLEKHHDKVQIFDAKIINDSTSSGSHACLLQGFNVMCEYGHQHNPIVLILPDLQAGREALTKKHDQMNEDD